MDETEGASTSGCASGQGMDELMLDGKGGALTRPGIGANGAAYRTRTCDPRITNAMLYQLS